MSKLVTPSASKLRVVTLNNETEDVFWDFVTIVFLESIAFCAVLHGEIDKHIKTLEKRVS